MKHPVFDHTASLRRQAGRFGLHCTATEWLGWDQPYAFRCAAGHEFMLAAEQLRRENYGGCRMCKGVESLRRLHEAAERNGVRCLSTEWAGSEGLHLFECSEGHKWHHTVRSTLRCRLCGQRASALARRDRQGLQRLQQAAAARGGQCLSEAYTLGIEFYRFRCVEGHEWEAKGHQVFDGSWCPQCAHAQRRAVPPEPQQELARLREAADARGGTCLDQESPGIGARYRFRCSLGHEWSALAERILHFGSWCRLCVDAARAARTLREDGLQRLQALAAERGGECLSTEYHGLNHRVRLRCAKGHQWEPRASEALKGSWCLLCAHDNRRLSIKDAQEAAAARGGQCLSDTYVNIQTKLTWMCDRGHVWQANLNNVRSGGTWCKQCSSMSYISNRNSKARIKYQRAGSGYETAASGSAPAGTPAKPNDPGAGTSRPIRRQGALNFTTCSGETDARTPMEDSSII